MQINLEPNIEKEIRKLISEGKQMYQAGIIINMDDRYYWMSNGGCLHPMFDEERYGGQPMDNQWKNTQTGLRCL